jgi:hypothetical protein
MKALSVAFREVAGLFVDDGSLALEILAVVILAAIAATFLPAVPLAAGGILLLGCVGVLFANVTTATRRR